MIDFLSTHTAAAVIMVAVAAMLVAVAVYLLDKVRRGVKDEPAKASDLLSNFREIHSQGGLSDEEYRTIKGMLAKRLEHELNSSSREADKLLNEDPSAGTRD